MFKHIFYELEGAAPNGIPVEPQQAAASAEEADLARREEELTLRENRIAAQERLKAANIPDGFLDFLVNKDIAVQNEGIDRLIKLWNTGLKEAVKSRIASDAPVAAVPAAKKFSELTYAERLALKRSNPDVYQLLVSQA